VLVNNAGICRVVSFEEMTPGDFAQTMEINFGGTVNMCRAAWPHMIRAGYGRIVNVSSGSMAGIAWQTAYAASKGAVYSFTRGLASDGEHYGIKANSLIPGALTRMVYAAQGEDSAHIAETRDVLLPERVAPMVAFLAHESVPVTGECLESMGGHVSRYYLARTPGFDDPDMTPETLAERWPEIMAGTPEGVSTHKDFDPRLWSPKAYVPVVKG
jgi:NAD(P)-dependent dehydrogenase (short-subunit alcohol dehydrogenase family)